MVKYIFLIVLALVSSIGINGQNAEEMITFVGKAPVFDGDLKVFISSNTIYPQSAINDSIEGTVFVEFWIDTIGHTIGHSVVKGVREDLDKEALRVTQLISFKTPAYQKDKAIVVPFCVPVIFEKKDISKKSTKLQILLDTNNSDLWKRSFDRFRQFDQ